MHITRHQSPDNEAIEDVGYPAQDSVRSDFDPNGIVRYPEACRITGLSKQSIENRLAEGGRYFDETFPKKHPLSNLPNGAVGFLRGELYTWAANRHQGNRT